MATSQPGDPEEPRDMTLLGFGDHLAPGGMFALYLSETGQLGFACNDGDGARGVSL